MKKTEDLYKFYLYELQEEYNKWAAEYKRLATIYHNVQRKITDPSVEVHLSALALEKEQIINYLENVERLSKIKYRTYKQVVWKYNFLIRIEMLRGYVLRLHEFGLGRIFICIRDRSLENPRKDINIDWGASMAKKKALIEQGVKNPMPNDFMTYFTSPQMPWITFDKHQIKFEYKRLWAFVPARAFCSFLFYLDNKHGSLYRKYFPYKRFFVFKPQVKKEDDFIL